MTCWLGVVIVVVVAIAMIRRIGLYLDRTSYDRTLPTGPVKRTVTLIHGTWPRGPLRLWLRIPWYRDDSPMCAALIRDNDTAIYRLAWSVITGSLPAASQRKTWNAI